MKNGLSWPAPRPASPPLISAVITFVALIALISCTAQSQPHLWRVPASKHPEFGVALGIAFDGSSNNDEPSLIATYFAATGSPRSCGTGRIVRISLSGPDEARATVIAGNSLAGSGAQGDGDIARTVSLRRPSSPIVRPNGDIMFLEGGCERVWLRVISRESGRIETILGSDRLIQSASDGTQVQIKPVAIAQSDGKGVFVVGRSETDATAIWRLEQRAGRWLAQPIVGGGKLALSSTPQPATDVELPPIRGIVVRSDNVIVTLIESPRENDVAYVLLEAHQTDAGDYQAHIHPQNVVDRGKFLTWFTRLVETEDQALFGMRASGVWRINKDLTEIRNVAGKGNRPWTATSDPVATDIALSPDGGLFYTTGSEGIFYADNDDGAPHSSFTHVLDSALRAENAGQTEVALQAIRELRCTAMTPKTTHEGFYNACFNQLPTNSGRQRNQSVFFTLLPIELIGLLSGHVQFNVANATVLRLRARMALDTVLTDDNYASLRKYIAIASID